MSQIVTLPFAKAATGFSPGGRSLEKFILGETVDVVVPRRVASDLTLVAVIQAGGGVAYPQNVWEMDGQLWRPVETGRRFDGRGSVSRVPADGALQALIEEDGWGLTSMRWELPTAAMPRACYDRLGNYDYDYRSVPAAHPRKIESVENDDARSRLAALSRSLMVVDGELWTECPPPRFLVENVEIGPILVPASEVYFAQTHDPSRPGRQVFRLDRYEEALAFCEAATSRPCRPEHGVPTFEIIRPKAIAFDDLLETAAASALPNMLAVAGSLSWFSHAGLEDFAIAKAAFGRLRESFPAREDAVSLFEAFGRLAIDPGDPAGIFEAPDVEILRALANLSMRTASFETVDLPEIAIGTPAP